MNRPDITGIHHVKLPVTDLAASVVWYERVLGFQIFVEFPDEDGVVRGVAGTLAGLGDASLALRENPDVAKGINGFDPVSFGIADRAAAEAWVAWFDELGVEHSPVIDATIGWIVSTRDPDGTEIRFYSFSAHGIDQSKRPGFGRIVAPRGV